MNCLDTMWQLGLSGFSPDCEASRSGPGMAGIDSSVTRGSTNVFVREFGCSCRDRPALHCGIPDDRNGSMNTDYSRGQALQMSA